MAGSGDIKQLQAQINRFVGQGTFTAKIPITGQLDQETVARALAIVQRRAADSGDKAAVEFTTKGLAETNPAAFVQTNLAAITEAIRTFGDAHKLLPVKSAFRCALPFLAGLAVVGAGIAGFLYFHNRRPSGPVAMALLADPDEPSPAASKTKLYLLLGGSALVGGFFAYHKYSKWAAEEKARKIREAVIAGQLSARDGLEALLANAKKPSGDTSQAVKILPATVLKCDDLFPPSVRAAIPGMDIAMAAIRERGDCR